MRKKTFYRALQVALCFSFIASTTSVCLALDFPVQDESLKRCLKKLAVENQWQETTDFTEITCHNQGITSLEGIEHFIKLTKLSLYKNRLTQVSIKGLGQLAHLNLAKNGLKKAELSNLPMLRDLFLFNNSLSTLTLVDISQLTQLKANSNALTSVEFKNLKALKKLNLFDNKLEKIDIQSTPAIKYLDVRHNPMPDEFYDHLDEQPGLTALHDGNSEDWQ